jgi:hypothetical protein
MYPEEASVEMINPLFRIRSICVSLMPRYVLQREQLGSVLECHAEHLVLTALDYGFKLVMPRLIIVAFGLPDRCEQKAGEHCI